MNIYYTAYLVNNWREVFTDQLGVLIHSGLLANTREMFIHAYPDIDEIYKLTKHFKNITLIQEPENRSEIPALHNLSTTEEDYNLYFHSKGVTHNTSAPVKCWREYMNYFNISLWRECVDCLQSNDAVGVNFQFQPFPHFSGNFWWATKTHIKNIRNLPNERGACEWYIASIPGKYMSLHNSNINHYHTTYDTNKWLLNKQAYLIK